MPNCLQIVIFHLAESVLLLRPVPNQSSEFDFMKLITKKGLQVERVEASKH